MAALASLETPFSPETWIPAASEKLNHLAEHAEDYNVFFLGSSRVMHGLVPELFDRRMAEAGQPTRTFNLALDGLRPPEDAYLLDQVLSRRHGPLRWVILEANPIRFRFDDDNDDTLRGLYWHDWTRMGWMLRRALTGKQPAERRWWQRLGEFSHEYWHLQSHCFLALQNALHLSGGAALLGQWTGLAESEYEETRLGPRGDGYRSFGTEPMTRKDAREFASEMERLGRKRAKVDYADPTSQLLIQNMRQRVAAAGGELIMLVPPTTKPVNFFPDPAYGASLQCLDFCDPQRLPELFLPGNRRDDTHVNETGAQRMTELLVQALLDSQTSAGR